MKIDVTDLFIAGTSVLIKVSLTVDDKHAIVWLAREVETESWEIHTDSELVKDLSSEFTDDETKEIEKYVADNSGKLFNQCAEISRAKVIELSKQQLESSETEGNEKDL